MLGSPMTFLSEPSDGFFLEIDRKDSTSSDVSHTFCGRNDMRGAFCPNCRKPLLQLMLFDVRDYRLHLEGRGFPILSLLFCWTCDLSQGLFYYAHLADGSVKILEYRKGQPYEDFPYENYPVSFPESTAVLEPISSADQDTIRALNSGSLRGSQVRKTQPRLCKPRHQLGGEPYLVQRNMDKVVRCCVCRQAMPFFASIGDDGPEETRFTENDYVQVLFHCCRKCNVVAAYQQCD